MLVELACADSYGSAFECLKVVPDWPNDLSGYHQHPSHGNPDGTYTDDTQMSIAVCEAMLEGRAKDFLLTKELLADKFVSCFKRDERPGYAGGFYLFLQDVPNGKEFLARIKPDSERNGAAMRSVPIGLLNDFNKVTQLAELQARITHNTDGGVKSSQAVALMAHYFYHRLGPSERVHEWLNVRLPGPWLTRWKGRVRVHGMDTAHACCHLLSTTKSLAELIRKSVDLGGDTDSVAAISAGCGSLAQDITNDIPQILLDELENRTYGRDFLKRLDVQMFQEFPR